MMRVGCIVLAAALWSCPHHDEDFDPSGYACAVGDTCLSGYVCHPFTSQCVEALAVGCRAGYICPSDIDDGDPCSSVGSFIPCDDRGDMDCADGCRTCRVDLTWGPCQTRSDAQP